MTEPPDLRLPGAYDATRPLVLGYLRASLLPSPQQLADAREQLALVAHTAEYTLGAVFTEQAETAPAAFSALVDAVKHYLAKGVVVPSAEHLAVLGTGQALSDYLQRVTGVPLIVVHVPGASARTAGGQPQPPQTPASGAGRFTTPLHTDLIETYATTGAGAAGS